MWLEQPVDQIMSVLTATKSRELLAFAEVKSTITQNKVVTDRIDEERSSNLPKTSRWRPSFHLLAPHGWLNDPCGLGYDPSTGLYHVAFQWNPNGNDWGNISWGHSTSSDLVSWKTSLNPALTPSTAYDHCGIFTGCLRATDVHGTPGALTYIYTSVQHLPIHYSLPYVTGSESLSLAVSHDGGVTWEREPCNPVLPGSPSSVKVTGWRDPFLGSWPSLDNELGAESSKLYGFISGGIVGETPTVFVYHVSPNDLRDWKYLGPLVNVGLNFSPSRWSGDFGVNWEVANFMTLSDEDGVSRDFVVMGTEGCVKSDQVVATKSGRAQEKRTPRQQLWMSVKEKAKSDSERSSELAEYSFAGTFDHGCYYAANGFYDPKAAQHIVFGWITEEDLPDNLRHAQGWSGLISLPRVLALKTLRSVVKARRSDLAAISSIEANPNADGTYTVHTLGFRPDERLEKLRSKSRGTSLHDLELHSSSVLKPMSLKTSRWEIDAEFAVRDHCGRVGFEVAHSADLSHRTIICWEPDIETFIIERPTSHESGINHGVETGPHTLFTFRNADQGTEEETLRIHAFFDMSVLEVFVNERTAISTRVYSPENLCFGVRFFAQAPAGSAAGACDPAAVLVRANIWDGLEA